MYIRPSLMLAAAVTVACAVPRAEYRTPPGATLEASFTDRHLEKYHGRTTLEVPPAFELANVLLAMHDSQVKNWQIDASTVHYRRVQEAFDACREHDAVKLTDLPQGSAEERTRWYGFRENSLRYELDLASGRLSPNGVYRTPLFQPDLFGEFRKPLEDFVSKCGFARFYEERTPYYDEVIRLTIEHVQPEEMKTWLDRNFPSARFDSLRVVLSPLVLGSHSATSFKAPAHQEVLAVVAGVTPEYLKQHGAPKTRAVLSRVVFTEIDHPYANWPEERGAEITEALGPDLAVWNTAASSYSSAARTINEYLTWAAFAAYASETFTDDQTRALALEDTARVMVQQRSFPKYREFQDHALKLFAARPAGTTFADLYPQFAAWFAANRAPTPAASAAPPERPAVGRGRVNS